VDEDVPCKIYTDQKRYKQVLFNLLGNASKFTFTGFIAVKVKFDDGWLMSEVIDTGIGISEEDLKKLF
jgi:two-component system, sensor histidine kinase